METQTHVQCKRCRCQFNSYFAKFKRCPLCRGILLVRVRQGFNATGEPLPKWVDGKEF